VSAADPALEPLVALYRLHTRLFLDTLDGVADAEAVRRVDDRTNSLAFVAARVVA
jgi:hypothetical protein